MATPISVPSTGLLLSQFVGIALVLAAAMGLARAGRGRSTGSRLVGLSLIVGPLMGLAFAGLYFATVEVSPLDVLYTFTVFAGIGTIAGLIGALVIELSCPVPSRAARAPGAEGPNADAEATE